MKSLYAALVVLLMTTIVRAEQQFIGYSPDNFPQEYCLALNIYYETRNSTLADAAATADVVLNRVQDTRYPNTICEVVKQGKKNADGSMKRNACQFSWYCDGKNDRPQLSDAWIKAQTTAWAFLNLKHFRGITEGATHYHAHYVNPRWARSLVLIGTIGAHKYYRWD